MEFGVCWNNEKSAMTENCEKICEKDSQLIIEKDAEEFSISQSINLIVSALV